MLLLLLKLLLSLSLTANVAAASVRTRNARLIPERRTSSVRYSRAKKKKKNQSNNTPQSALDQAIISCYCYCSSYCCHGYILLLQLLLCPHLGNAF